MRKLTPPEARCKVMRAAPAMLSCASQGLRDMADAIETLEHADLDTTPGRYAFYCACQSLVEAEEEEI